MVDLVGFLFLALIVLYIVSMWKVYTKAGKPGWGVLIPFYNIYLLAKIAGKPGWWLILLLIPYVDIVFGIIVAVEVARNFGKSGGFAVGIIFLPFIFYPILAFGSATYRLPPGGPAVQGPGSAIHGAAHGTA